jgi:hypothetical protein
MGHIKSCINNLAAINLRITPKMKQRCFKNLSFLEKGGRKYADEDDIKKVHDSINELIKISNPRDRNTLELIKLAGTGTESEQKSPLDI